MGALVMVQTMRYYCPNLLLFKQRTKENSLKSILFFAEGFKDEMILKFQVHIMRVSLINEV